MSVPEWGRNLVWLCLLGTAVALSSRTTEAFELPKVALLRAVALVLAVGMAAVFLAGPHGWPRLRDRLGDAVRDPLAVGIVLTVLVAALSTAASVSPRTSLLGAQGSFAGLATIAAYAVLFFAARGLGAGPEPARSVLSGAVIGLGVAVVYGAAQLVGLDPLRWEAPIAVAGVHRVFSTQGHPNSLSQLLVAGTPLAVFFAFAAARAGRWGEATGAGLVAAGAVGLSLLTVSRAGVLGLATAIAAAFWGAGGLRRGRARGSHLGTLAAACVGVGGTALVLATALDPSGVLEAMRGRLAGSADPRHLGQDPRLFVWSGAWAAFCEHPLLGVGVDALSLAYGRYRTAAGWSAEWGETPLKAHNQVLEILATRGILGGAAALVVLFGVGRAAFRALRGAEANRGLAVAATSSLAALGAHNLFHFPTTAATTLAVTLAGVLSRLADSASDEAKAPPVTLSARAGFLATAAAAAAVYALVLVPLRADVLAQAATVVLRTDPHRAVTLAGEAVRLDPGRDLLWLRLGAALQSLGLAASAPDERRRLLQDARRAGEQGVALVPASAYGQAHLGTLLSDLERETPPLAARREVEAAFAKAAGLDPVNADILVAAANAALAGSDPGRAREWASGCAALYPHFASPRALLGAIALAEARGLVEAGEGARAREKLEEAVLGLKESLAADWHGDERARAAAEANLAAARALAPALADTVGRP